MSVKCTETETIRTAVPLCHSNIKDYKNINKSS